MAAIALLALACGDDAPEGYRLVTVSGVGKFWIDDNPAKVKRRLASGRPYEPDTIALMRKRIRPGSVAVDVGAHIGSITVPMAGVAGHVHSFEPQKKLEQELRWNVEVNGLTNVTTHRTAIGDHEGSIELRSEGVEHDGQRGIDLQGEVVEVVPIRTLDSFGLSDVSFVKIDVEGHQLEVLMGARKTIAESRPLLLVEMFGDKIDESRELLRSWGYEHTGMAGRNELWEPIGLGP
jgi:FkbM family methyltransferase